MNRSASIRADLVLPGHTLPGNGDAELDEADQATIRLLLQVGIGENSLRAIRSDLIYIEAWAIASTGESLAWPPARSAVIRFIAHHLWLPDQKAIDPDHGMPIHVRDILARGKYLRSEGPHAPSTVRRRLSSWKSICLLRNVDHPFDHPDIRATLRSAVRASGKPRLRKSKGVVDRGLVTRLLDHLDRKCSDAESLANRAELFRALRDRAIIAVMFASGGRRRSEIASLMHGQILPLESIETEDELWPDGIPSVGIVIGRTKTTNAADAATVFLTGRAVVALEDWRTAVAVSTGPVFSSIDRWGECLGPAADTAFRECDRERAVGRNRRRSERVFGAWRQGRVYHIGPEGWHSRT